jgi:hypothetical protein
MKIKDIDFYSDKIVLHKSGRDLIINRSEIENIMYVKPTFLNYLLSGIAPGGSTFPGRLEIKTELKIGKSKLHLVKIKYKEVCKLPDWCLGIIDSKNILKQ